MLGEVEKVLVLSTAHMPSSLPDFGEIRHVEHDFGFIVFVCLDDEEREMKLAPEWLRPLIKIANGQQCNYINFDADAPVDGNLNVWEW